MKIKKSSLETLLNYTKGTEGVLNLTDSRIRDNFIRPLTETTQMYFDDREKIYKTFCLKNEDETPNLLAGNKYQFPKEVLEDLNKELEILGNEEADINFTDNPLQIKGLLEKSEYKPMLLESEIIYTIINAI